MKDMFLIKVQVYPRNSGKNISYPDKNIPRPGPTRNKIPRPDPTRPENILQNVPRPRTGFGPVRSGPVRSGETRGFGLPRRSLSWSKKWQIYLKNYDFCENLKFGAIS